MRSSAEKYSRQLSLDIPCMHRDVHQIDKAVCVCVLGLFNKTQLLWSLSSTPLISHNIISAFSTNFKNFREEADFTNQHGFPALPQQLLLYMPVVIHSINLFITRTCEPSSEVNIY